MQQKLAGLMKRKSNDLIMNSGENAYQVQLAREKIDRVMPLVTDGKGRRYMSEFWSQPEYIKSDTSGDLCTTLTMKERGIYKPIEFIKCPKIIRKEKGLNSDESNVLKDIQEENSFTIRSRNTYLAQRNQELSDLMNEAIPYEPLMDDLAIVGEKVLKSEKKGESIDVQITGTDLKENVLHEVEETLESGKSKAQQVDSERNEPFINEPSLYINGHHLKWDPDPAGQPQVGMDIHLTFENENPMLQTDYIELFNNGNVVVTYEWTRVHQQNHFELANKDNRVFYFDSKPGLVQPGEIVHLPVTLKSPHEGIHKEIWRFNTTPVLKGMSPVRVHFHAICVWPEYHQFCSILAKDIFIQLEHEANYRMVYRILENLIMNIQPDERPPSPIPEPDTGEEIFALSNPTLNYRHSIIQKLKQLYKELKERECKILGIDVETLSPGTDNWKYSVSELRKMIYKYPPDMSKTNSAVKREEEFNRFFQSVDQLAFPVKRSFINSSVERYRIGCILLSQTFTHLFELCANLRGNHGLPELTSGPVKSQRGTKNVNQTYDRAPMSAVNRNLTQAKPSDEVSMENDDRFLQSDQLLLPEESRDTNELMEFIKTIPSNPDSWKSKACSIVYITLCQLLDDLSTCWNEI
ncbi:unnamed protein product [Heterobilharzia americana]|nr:unnamed protein product [Heterobilharzia americana]